MNRKRLVAAVTLLLAVAALLAWQQWRHRLIAECRDEGGIWDGSSCRPDERRIRIQRDLHRT